MHELLIAYREVTQQLGELLSTTDDLFDVEQLEQLLAERDRLIVIQQQKYADQELSSDLQELIAEIQKIDAGVQAQLQALMHKTQARIKGFNDQKRGLNAYSGDYSTDAMFIDRKK